MLATSNRTSGDPWLQANEREPNKAIIAAHAPMASGVVSSEATDRSSSLTVHHRRPGAADQRSRSGSMRVTSCSTVAATGWPSTRNVTRVAKRSQWAW